MSDKLSQPETEAELEAFRQRWREEVSARNSKQPGRPSGSGHSNLPPASAPKPKTSIAPLPHSASTVGGSSRREVADGSDEVEPKTYHDLPDREEALRLGTEGQNHDRNVRPAEPSTALEHYERAVDKETSGQLGDSIRHYRKAFKLDSGVHEAYKSKHFPPSSFGKQKPASVNPSNAAVTVPGTAHHSLSGSSAAQPALPPTLRELVDEFAGLRIEPPPPPTDASPPERCRISELPEEILSQILLDVAIKDVAAFARLSQVCKRLAYLVLTEEAIWKRIALGLEVGFGAMLYDYVCEIDGSPRGVENDIDALEHYLEDPSMPPPPTPEERELQRSIASMALTESLLLSTYSSSYRTMFRLRPRVRFNGVYISTVNYTRPGATSTNTLTWGVPVHVVTYFRYLRFFRDGSCISLLTTSEPAEVVHHLTKENMHGHHRADSLLPSAVMKDALRGRWRLSGPLSEHLDPVTGEPEKEGELHIETDGVVPKYTYRLLLGLGHAGKLGGRNNKLIWKGFWSYNRLTDDWGEFGLKNDRAFYWSRVKSFT